MHKIKRFSVNLIKGFLIGIGTVIPGVSGGTAAIIVGSFEEIIQQTANVSKHFLKTVLFLLPFGIGGCLGLYMFSPLIYMFCETSPTLSKWTLICLSSISLFIFYKKSFTKGINIKHLLFAVLGVLISSIFAIGITSLKTSFHIDSFWLLIIISMPLSVALILPAISFSQMLLFLGIYERTLFSINNFDLAFLFPLLFGLVFGVLIMSKLLSVLLSKNRDETYSFVLGFVIMSLAELIVK